MELTSSGPVSGSAPRVGPRVVAIASGKGGTGRSFIAANLATFLATLGKRVVLIDAAIGAASLHDFVGLDEVAVGLGDALLGGRPLDEVVVDCEVPGLRLVAGARDPAAIADLDVGAAAALVAAATRLDVDYVVLDLPSGTGRFAVDLFLAADLRVLAVAPEPTAIELGYRFAKVAFRRAAAATVDAIERPSAAAPAPDADRFALPIEGGIAGPFDLRERAKRLGEGGPSLIAALDAALAGFGPFVVLNGVRSKADMDVGAGVVRAAGRRLGIALRYLGHIEYDDAVWVSLRRRRPLMVEHPESRAAKCLEKTTRRLLGREAEPPPIPSFLPETHYQMLEIEPTASDEDLRRAYRRVRHTYGRDAIVVAGLYGRGRLDELHRRFDEAYSVLMDPARRKAYDAQLFPDGIPSGLPSAIGTRRRALAVTDRPPMPDIAADTDFTGALLQRVREARGLELREISDRTKVGMGYLAAIEDEDFPRLPAPVYVRGFLAEYARMLGVDAARVLETYFERFRRASSDRAAPVAE